ncbi:MAG: N-6 DNA methylase, partial [Pseudomonadota bacterium]|nr:N-6 DNA methylase [Pseudomonadota bacterium]
NGRCCVVVPEGVLFGATGAHKELRRQLIENNRVEAVLSFPGGVFQPYSGVKTSALLFRKGGKTKNVLFLHAESDGYKLDANHDTPIAADDLPMLIEAFRLRDERLSQWNKRNPTAEWAEKWWFADEPTLRANDFNLSAGRYRPMSQAQVQHQNPRRLLDELVAIEAAIAEEVAALRTASQDEQQRVVDLLSHAEGIVRLRRQSHTKAQAIIPALFYDMFGDPARNPKDLPLRRVRDFVARFEGGKNIQAGSAHGSPYRILKVSAVTSGRYIESESKPAPDNYMPPQRHLVQKGDMLFSRANTQELVGATAIVNETDGSTLLPDKLWRFVWLEPVEPLYIHALFQTPHVRGELGKLSSGTSASMRNISQAKLFELCLPIAPLDQQSIFARQYAAIHSIASTI